jgi:hypothetical protein
LILWIFQLGRPLFGSLKSPNWAYPSTKHQRFSDWFGAWFCPLCFFFHWFRSFGVDWVCSPWCWLLTNFGAWRSSRVTPRNRCCLLHWSKNQLKSIFQGSRILTLNSDFCEKLGQNFDKKLEETKLTKERKPKIKSSVPLTYLSPYALLKDPKRNFHCPRGKNSIF